MSLPRRVAIAVLCLPAVMIAPSIVCGETDAAGFERVLPDQVVWTCPTGMRAGRRPLR